MNIDVDFAANSKIRKVNSGFDGEQTNVVLLTILKTSLKKYVTNETMDIIESLVEWDLQPSFTEYEYIDKILKKNSDD